MAFPWPRSRGLNRHIEYVRAKFDRPPALGKRGDPSKLNNDANLVSWQSLSHFADVSIFSPKNFQAFPSNFAILKI